MSKPWHSHAAVSGDGTQDQGDGTQDTKDGRQDQAWVILFPRHCLVKT